MATIQLDTALLHSPGYRSCSPLAKAVLLDLLELFWYGDGFLVNAQGIPWTLEQLARQTGYTAKEFSKGIKELLAGGLLVEMEGIICLPAMSKKVQVRLARQAAGIIGAKRRWIAKKIGNLEDIAQKNGKNGKTDGKTYGKTDGKTDGKRDGKPDDLPPSSSGNGDGRNNRNLNGHSHLGESETARSGMAFDPAAPKNRIFPP